MRKDVVYMRIAVDYGHTWTQSSSRWDYQYDAQIAELQRLLNNKGFNLKVDSVMGDNTYNALCNYSFDKKTK